MVGSVKNKIPVLMYHALIDGEAPGVHSFHVLKHEFARQMEWLYTHGYKTLSLNELYDALVRGVKFEGNRVVLTFDDGYRSLYTHATPILEQYGFHAVLFLTTAAVGERSYRCLSHCTMYPPDDRPLTWGELEEMQRRGWEIQAHGHRHYGHTALDDKALEEEIKQSQQAIRDNLRFQSEFYCYPYGDYNANTLDKISELGFKAAFIVRPGFAKKSDDLRRICRISITVSDDIRLFRRKMRRGYGTIKELLKGKAADFISRNESLKMVVRRYQQRILGLSNLIP